MLDPDILTTILKSHIPAAPGVVFSAGADGGIERKQNCRLKTVFPELEGEKHPNLRRLTGLPRGLDKGAAAQGKVLEWEQPQWEEKHIPVLPVGALPV